jgi:hypothetical protein
MAGITDTLKKFNERFAMWATTSVSTMTCAYLFAIIAIVALPQAIHDTFSNGFQPLPLVSWLSQSFLQLTLLSIIMLGQELQSRDAEKRSVEQYNAVMETLADMRKLMTEEDEILADEDAALVCQEQEKVNMAMIASLLARIEARLS